MTTELANAAKLAPPRPDFTVNTGWTVRAVLPGSPAGNGLLQSWYVAAEQDGNWVTWNAYRMDGPLAGQLSYDAGHYFTDVNDAANRQDALADLAVRGGLLPGVARRVADDLTDFEPSAEEKRAARLLRKHYPSVIRTRRTR